MLPDLVALYNGHKFENQLTRFHLTRVALHAQALKYSQETKYTNYKDSISYTHNNMNCRCAETLTELLSPQQEEDENAMVQEKLEAGFIQDTHRQGVDSIGCETGAGAGNFHLYKDWKKGEESSCAKR